MEKLIAFLREFGLLAILPILAAALLVASLIVRTTFLVEASTEYVELQTRSGADVSWFFPAKVNGADCNGGESATGMARILSDGQVIASAFAGSITFSPDTKIFLIREGKGYFRVLARHRETAGSFQELAVEEVDVPGLGLVSVTKPAASGKLGREVQIEVQGLGQYLQDGCTWLLQLVGDVIVGQPVANATQVSVPLLLSGKLTMLAQTIGGESFFEASSVALGLGDAISVVGPLDPAENRQLIRGLLRIDDQPGFTVTYRTVGEKALIRRSGNSEGTYVSASLLSRIEQDPHAKRMGSVLVALVAIAVTWRGVDAKKKRKSR